MHTCPSCGGENPDGLKFCGECGSALGAEAVQARELRKLVTVVFADITGSFVRRLDLRHVAQDLRDVAEDLRHMPHKDLPVGVLLLQRFPRVNCLGPAAGSSGRGDGARTVKMAW
jgi:hypothetical protein